MGMGGGATSDRGTGASNKTIGGYSGTGISGGVTMGASSKQGSGGMGSNGLGVTTPKSYTQPAGGGWSNSGPSLGGSGAMAAGRPYTPGWGRVDLGGWSYGRPNPSPAHGGLLSSPDDAITTAPIPAVMPPTMPPWKAIPMYRNMLRAMRALNQGNYYSGGQWMGGNLAPGTGNSSSAPYNPNGAMPAGKTNFGGPHGMGLGGLNGGYGRDY